jgi:hypothetical protein
MYDMVHSRHFLRDRRALSGRAGRKGLVWLDL